VKVGQTIGFCRLSGCPALPKHDRPQKAMACPIYESAGSVKAFRWDFLGFVRPFEHTFTSG
jgi:hypothetical protein